MQLSPANPILEGWLSGTMQFMAPELYNNKEVKPITNDFSKIDIWALGVLLINMLTVDFAWTNIQTNFKDY